MSSNGVPTDSFVRLAREHLAEEVRDLLEWTDAISKGDKHDIDEETKSAMRSLCAAVDRIERVSRNAAAHSSPGTARVRGLRKVDPRETNEGSSFPSENSCVDLR